MEMAFTVLGILLAILGVYYAREQVLSQRRERLESRDKLATLAASRKPRDVLRRMRSSKLLRVGCLWYPPFVSYRTDRGSIVATGLYPDILKAVAKAEGVRINFSVLRWHEAISALEHGDIDVAACVLKSAERRTSCDFVGSIFRVGVGAVVRSTQKKISCQGDLARDDVSIAVTKGEIGWTYASENLGLAVNPVKFTVLEDKSIQTMMSLVEMGTVDCALADSLSCAQFIEASASKTLSDVFATTPIHVEDNALMLAKHNRDFAVWLESEITKVRNNDAVRHREREIESRYFGILHRTGARR